jgi:hypothetical protein
MSLLLKVVALILAVLAFKTLADADSLMEIRNYVKRADEGFREVVDRLQFSERKYRCQLKRTLKQINKTNALLESNSIAVNLTRRFKDTASMLTEFFTSEPFALNDTEGIDPKTNCFRGNDSIREYEEVMAKFLYIEAQLRANQTKVQATLNDSRRMFYAKFRKLNGDERNATISSLAEMNKTVSQNLLFQLDAKQCAYNISDILLSFKLKLSGYCVQKEALSGLFGSKTNTTRISTRRTTSRNIIKRGRGGEQGSADDDKSGKVVRA